MCSHVCLLGEEIWIRQPDQPCPFPGAGGASVGFCSCRKEMGLWQGRLLRKVPIALCKCCCCCLQSLLRARHSISRSCVPWAQLCGQGKNGNGRSAATAVLSLPLLHLQAPLYLKNIKSFLYIRTDAFRAGYFAEHILYVSVILKTKCVSQ